MEVEEGGRWWEGSEDGREHSLRRSEIFHHHCHFQDYRTIITNNSSSSRSSRRRSRRRRRRGRRRGRRIITIHHTSFSYRRGVTQIIVAPSIVYNPHPSPIPPPSSPPVSVLLHCRCGIRGLSKPARIGVGKKGPALAARCSQASPTA
ncbi:uncharacterized protein [Physcomitrium patens]|uniref:uncharacterized protein isoform X2 n=1 Tax=Physcomitrium patens TaxID=3218 RepID=UPI000D170B06|nr:uncharacterized protein LOC112295300 [Physcomitrium patens]|eukprot:XP_024402439.1 uncharacterized protein LOC112295300 [Physcomitrella patens]